MRSGRLIVGSFLVVAGVAWLMDSLGLVALSAGMVLSVGLILVGVALLVTSARPGGHGGLIILGVILTLVLGLGTTVRDRADAALFRGGIGDRVERPSTRAEAQRTFELGAGNLRLDLTALGATRSPIRVRARVGTGELTVVVPSHAAVRITSHVQVGRITVFGQERGSGLDVTDTFRGGDGGPVRLNLDLRAGAGRIVVDGRPTPDAPPEPYRRAPSEPRVGPIEEPSDA